MKVLYIHQYFGTPKAASGLRSYQFARALVTAGHSVTMVCGITDRTDPSFDPRPGQVWSETMIEGIRVILIPSRSSNRYSLMKRARAFASYSLRSTLLALREQYDLVFATSTPLTAALPGIAGSLFRGKPFVFEVRDLWPELPKALGMTNPLLLGGMSLLEWLAYRSASGCIGLSPGIVEGIRGRSRPGQPIAMIPNGCDLDYFQPGERSPCEIEGINPGDFVAGFTGAHGVANGLSAAVDAAGILKARGRQDIKFLFVGDGNEKARIVELARQGNLDNCVFRPLVDKLSLIRILQNLDCGLMLLKNVPAFYYGTSPNKFFDYIAAGLPVLNNYPGWLADLIREHRCGVVVPPDDPVAFADALELLHSQPSLRREMGNRARRLAEARFARKDLAGQFLEFLESVGPAIEKGAAAR